MNNPMLRMTPLGDDKHVASVTDTMYKNETELSNKSHQAEMARAHKLIDPAYESMERAEDAAEHADDTKEAIEVIIPGAIEKAEAAMQKADDAANLITTVKEATLLEMSERAIEIAAAQADANTAAQTATLKANLAAESKIAADYARDYAIDASQEAAESATKSQSYAVGGTGSRENEDHDNALYFYEKLKDIFVTMQGSLRPMGTITFEQLIALTDPVPGDMYNISEDFVSDETFKDGADITYACGTNIYRTSDGFWDALPSACVAAVKGATEETFRKGNVVLTAENVGALPLIGGVLTGNTTIEKNGSAQLMVHSADTGTKGVLVANSTGFGLYDSAHSKWIVNSDASGKVTLNGTASGCLPLTGGTLSGEFFVQKTGGANIWAINSTTGAKGCISANANGEFGLYNANPSKWIAYCDASGNVTLNGNANTATKLATPRALKVSLSGSAAAYFDGTSGVMLGVEGTLPVANGGTGATTAVNARSNLGLGVAATYGATSSVTNGSSSLVTSGAVYSAVAGRIPYSGGTLTGALNFKNSTWNKVGDDAYFGDYNAANCVAFKGVSGGTGLALVATSGNMYCRVLTDAAGNDLYLAANGAVYVSNGTNSARAPIYASAFNQSSSARVKENVSNVSEEEAMKLLKLRPVNYDYIGEEAPKGCTGLIAEEVAKVLPNCVNGNVDCADDDEEAIKEIGIDYSKFVPYLIKLVQMQEERIKELENKLQ